MSAATAEAVIEPVTVVVRRMPLRGREAEFERWLAGVVHVARLFPGHLGATVLRDGRAFTLVFRFATPEDLARWDASPEKADWVARGDAMCEAVTVNRLSGLETWFTLPSGGTVAPPPRWKMAIVSFAVAFPIIQVLLWLASLTIAGLPWLVRGAIVCACMSICMTWLGMPLATRLLRRWLYPAAP